MSGSATRHRNLVIVGSGPVGMVAALLLQEHFEQVTLLERRTQEDFLQAQGFTFPIVFSPASIRILQQIGIWDAIRAERSEFFGVVIHQRVLGRELSFTAVREGVYSHWRNHVVAKLYEQVQAAGIPIHFEARVEAIDFKNSVCREARLGDLPFDVLLGADGSNSQTRRLLAQAHPDFPAGSFKRTGLDHWYAYRVASRGAMRERFAGGERHHASNVFLSNLAAYPSEKLRIVTTGMRQPEEEISILIKYDPAITLSRLKVLNDSHFGPLVGSQQELDAAWQAGYAGRFDQVEAPTFHLNRVLLIGDAAHGFESTGDLINLGLASTGYLREVLSRQERTSRPRWRSTTPLPVPPCFLRRLLLSPKPSNLSNVGAREKCTRHLRRGLRAFNTRNYQRDIVKADPLGWWLGWSRLLCLRAPTHSDVSRQRERRAARMARGGRNMSCPPGGQPASAAYAATTSLRRLLLTGSTTSSMSVKAKSPPLNRSGSPRSRARA